MNHLTEPGVGFTLEDRLAVEPVMRAVVDIMFQARIEVEVRDAGTAVSLKF